MICPVCEECCSCHINPPCNFCVEHQECSNCGELRCDVDEDLELCADCYALLAQERRIF